EPVGVSDPGPTDQNIIDHIALELQLILGAHHGQGYGGVVVSAARGVVTVYRTEEHAAGIDAVIAGRSDARHIRVASARYSHAYLSEIRDRVSADLDYWRRRGTVLTSLGVGARGEAVDIGVESLVEVAAVEQRYDGLPVAVTVVRPVPF
ncbi:hypothetical protein, partial [Candidatus Frankia nodulisporulans]|uniref:hypothetical protein n=2 Tax=Candidatus Frankia nodulisporulans TaxID=2060052 RepID=UPI001581D268